MAKISMDCKKLMVKEISSRLNSVDTLIVTNYKGLSAQDLNDLRRELRNISGEYVIVKDSMIKHALADGVNNRIAEFIEGEVGIVVDRKEDPTCISKILMRFSKDHEVLKIRGGIVKGTILSKEDIASLAALPSRQVLLGKLANVLNAPIEGIARALQGIISKLVYALDAVKKIKEETKAQGSYTKSAETTKVQEEAEEAQKTGQNKDDAQAEYKELNNTEDKKTQGGENGKREKD